MDIPSVSSTSDQTHLRIDLAKTGRWEALNDTVLVEEHVQKVENPYSYYDLLLGHLDRSDLSDLKSTAIKVAIWVTLGLPLLIAAFIDDVNSSSSPSFDNRKEITSKSVKRDNLTRWDFIQIDKGICSTTIAKKRLIRLKDKYSFLIEHYNTPSELASRFSTPKKFWEKEATRLELAIGADFQNDLNDLEKSVGQLPFINDTNLKFKEATKQVKEWKDKLEKLEPIFSELEKTIEIAFLSLFNSDKNKSNPLSESSQLKIANEFNEIGKDLIKLTPQEKIDVLYSEVFEMMVILSKHSDLLIY